MINLFDSGRDYKKLAVEKIDAQAKEFEGNNYGNAVKTYVANALREFCEKSEDFARAVYLTKRSFSDCVAEIMKDCGKHISDIEVYRRAAKFYFPNSEVDFVMTITIAGDAPDEKYLNKEATKNADEKPVKKNKDGDAEPVADEKKKQPKKENEVIQISFFD